MNSYDASALLQERFEQSLGNRSDATVNFNRFRVRLSPQMSKLFDGLFNILPLLGPDVTSRAHRLKISDTRVDIFELLHWPSLPSGATCWCAALQQRIPDRE